MKKAHVLVVDDHFELAELLSAALENEGVLAVVAGTGEEALVEARRNRPALAIVDLVLPDMLGTELLDALASLDEPVPCVAMSGVFRGERYCRDITRRHRAKKFFEKPFSTTVLVAEVMDLLNEFGLELGSKSDGKDAPLDVDLSSTVHLDSEEDCESFPDAAQVLDHDEADGEREPSRLGTREGSLAKSEDELSKDTAAAGASADEQRRRRQMGFVEEMVPLSEAQSTSAGARRGPSRSDCIEHVSSSTSDPISDEPASGPGKPSCATPDPGMPSLAPSSPGRKPRFETNAPARGGEIAESSVPRLLAAFHAAQSTGALELKRGRVTKVIYLRDGRPTFAGSNLAGDRLIRFAVNRKEIRQEDADSALALAKEEGRRIGEVLIELGVLDRRNLQRLVRDQVRAIIWSTFAWREGDYSIRPHREGRREPITLSLPLGRLVLEGTLRAVPLLVLREDLGDEVLLAPSSSPTVPVEDLALDVEQARLLVAADGSKTIADLMALSDDDERRVRATLKALWDLGVLTPREQLESDSRRIGFVV